MIARLWHGWVRNGAAPRYAELLRSRILPEFRQVRGCEGAYVFRRATDSIETEFMVLTLFTDMQAVERFAGENHEQARVPEDARRLLSDYDHTASHYEVVTTPKKIQRDALLEHLPRHRVGWNW